MDTEQKQSLTSEPRWYDARTTDLPAKTPVTLFYDGLLGLCYNPWKKHAEIGVLSTAPSHNPRLHVIGVTDNGQARTLLEMSWLRTEPIFRKARLSVTHSSEDKPLFYMPFVHKEDHPQDFRWLTDIDILHSQKLDKESNGFSPRFILKQGIFYTLLRTKEAYKAYPQDGGTPIDLSRIAHMTAANIACNSTEGMLKLAIDNQSSGYQWSVQGRRLFVIIQHNCESPNDPWCRDGNTSDTDFDLYYDALKPSATVIRHKVTADGDPSPPDLSNLDRDLKKALLLAGILHKNPEGKVISTNEAPCGRTGFGFSDKLI